jgi:hypothetical protein
VPAPPTIEAMAKDIYDKAAVCFPFVGFIVAHPFEDMTKDLRQVPSMVTAPTYDDRAIRFLRSDSNDTTRSFRTSLIR